MGRMIATTWYKVLAPDGTPVNGGHGKWSLPHDGQSGEWMPKRKPVLCETGWHLCKRNTVVQFLRGNAVSVFVAEGRGRYDVGWDKISYEQARLVSLVGTLDTRRLRLLAADFAERALPRFEKRYPHDGRPRAAIQAARDYAEGSIDAAARAAAWAAAWASAWDAERAWQTERLFTWLETPELLKVRSL